MPEAMTSRKTNPRHLRRRLKSAEGGGGEAAGTGAPLPPTNAARRAEAGRFFSMKANRQVTKSPALRPELLLRQLWKKLSTESLPGHLGVPPLFV